MTAVYHLHKSGIDALGETRMIFDQGAQRCHSGMFNIIDYMYRMRVTQRYGRNFQFLIINVQRLYQVIRICLKRDK